MSEANHGGIERVASLMDPGLTPACKGHWHLGCSTPDSPAPRLLLAAMKQRKHSKRKMLHWN